MNLFSKEKEIIFKITNAVLLIWFVAALVLICTNTISLLVKDPSQNYTYDEYKSLYCGKDVYDNMSSTEIEESCQTSYNNSKLNNESSDYYKLLYVYGAAANIIIVGGVLYFLNKEPKEKKKK